MTKASEAIWKGNSLERPGPFSESPDSDLMIAV